MHVSKSVAGYTLPELIITIAILAIVTGFATQSWNTWVGKARHRAILENYHTLFAFARWTAASQRSIVTACPLSATNECVDDWQKPVSVFIDNNKDRKPDDDVILRQVKVDLTSYSLRSRTASRGYFRFNASGMSEGAMGSLVLCPQDTTQGTMTYMPVNIAGRFRVEYDTDGDGIMRLPWGAKISC
ncbi:GspH/FimT family pseudopilin [Marinobacter sediminum]|uniref:GspH/FimT family protein n=1 Tax=Marinobacter sediminum TaxID=256323 RepID=UPI002030FE7F|nr:GspH/FimT family pseudopilin [Marinobacter sediminum]MCM0610995.1 GspH/FimT family pseudopilin [Marinobacter sediminum]